MPYDRFVLVGLIIHSSSCSIRDESKPLLTPVASSSLQTFSFLFLSFARVVNSDEGFFFFFLLLFLLLPREKTAVINYI